MIQTTRDIAKDLDEIVIEAKAVQRHGLIFREHTSVYVNSTLASVFLQVFSLADRIVELADGKSREIESTPTAYLIRNLKDVGSQANDLQDKVGKYWRQEKGYSLKEDCIEKRFYGELRDFCYSMTDILLIGEELERRFSSDGMIMNKTIGKASLVGNFIFRHVETVLVGIFLAWIVYFVGWN